MSKGDLFTSERGIILAADMSSMSQLESLLSSISGIPELVAVKIGFNLGLRHGLKAVVGCVKGFSARFTVIYDHQKAGTDIPAMADPLSELCLDAGVDAIIFFPHAGPKTLEHCITCTQNRGLSPIIGIVMTHPAYLQSEGGYICDNAPDHICKIAVEMGVKSFVLPGTKLELVSKFAGGQLAAVQDARILMPGIGAQGGTVQAAFRAAAPHNCFAIVGSALYKASDVQAAMSTLAGEVRQ